MHTRLLLLTEADVTAVLTPVELVEVMATALAEFSAGLAQQPPRPVIMTGTPPRWFGFMPAFVPSQSAVGAKIVSVRPPAPDVAYTHQAVILLLDPDTGAIVSLLDGRYITEQRTAAVSAVAVAHLATRPVRSVGLFGAGVQAASHLDLLATLHPLAEVRVWSPGAGREALAARVAGRWTFPVRAVGHPEEAARGADVIVLATAASQPVLMSAWVAPGTLVVSVGACRPTQREMDPELLRRSRLYVDSRLAATCESGDIVQALAAGLIDHAHVLGELGDVVGGSVQGRVPGDERPVIFKSLGMGVEDVAAAQLAFDRARAQGRGTWVTV
jgi:ornithine cyclodeaminase/alanine dehydrogenase-like protein (mu-crystallin family)